MSGDLQRAAGGQVSVSEVEPAGEAVRLGEQVAVAAQRLGFQGVVADPGEADLDGVSAVAQVDRPVDAARLELLRVPLADGTLVATPGQPESAIIPSLLAASDVLGTGWFGASATQAGPGKTVGVVGDGAVGLSAVLAARQLGAERVIAMPATPTARPSSAPSARPTLSPSAATRAWPGSRGSPRGSAPTQSSRPSAPRTR